MEKFFKYLLIFFLFILLASVSSVVFLIFDANDTDELHIVKKNLDSIKSTINSDIKLDKVSNWKRNFILKVSIRGLPRLIKLSEECQDSVRKELNLRGLALQDVILNDRVAKEIAEVQSWHMTNFRMKTKRIIEDLNSIFFPFDKKKRVFEMAKYSGEIPKSFFFNSFNIFLSHSRCISPEYINLLYQLSEDKKALVKSKLYRPLAYLHELKKPINFFPGYLREVSTGSKKLNYNDYKLVLYSTRKIEDYLSTNIDASDYENFIKEVNKVRNDLKSYLKKYRRKPKRKLTKKNTKKDEESLKQKIKNLYEEFRKLPQQEKDEIYKGSQLLYSYMGEDKDLLVEEMMTLDIESLEYKIKGAAVMLKALSSFLKDSIYEHLRFERTDTEREVISKISYIASNLDKFIDKNSIERGHNFKKLSNDEREQLESLLKKLNNNGN